MSDKEGVDIFSPLSSIHWKECCKLPEKVHYAQCVLLKGKIFLGSNVSRVSRGCAKLFVSSTDLTSWTTFPTPTVGYALTTYHSQPVLVGGFSMVADSMYIMNELWVSSAEEINWESSLPPMPTPRHSSSAVETENSHYLIVAGGTGESGRMLDVVEILKQGQWSTLPSLPKRCTRMSSVIHDGKWYLVGGWDRESLMFYCNLDSLGSQMSKSTALWNTRSAPYGCLSSFGTRLISISSEISVYSNQKWIFLEDLTMYGLACIVAGNELIVIESPSVLQRHGNEVYKATLQVSSFDPDNHFSTRGLHWLEDMGIQIMSSLASIYRQLKTLAGVPMTVDIQHQTSDEMFEEHPQETIEIFIIHWKSKSQNSRYPPTWRSLLDILKDLGLKELNQRIENAFYGRSREYLAAYHQILATRGSLDMLFLKMVLVGPPRMGKTSMRRRMTGEITDISSAGESEEPSTGAVESSHVIIRSLSSTTAVISADNWSSIKGISDEARMLLQFFYETNSMVVSEPAPTVDISHLTTPEIVVIPPSSDISSCQSSVKVEEDKMEDVQDAKPPVEAQPLKHESSEYDPFDVTYAIDMNDMLMKAMASKDWKQIKYTLEYTGLIKMEDTGGQPEFMDMLPALVMGPSLYLIFCKLIDDLKSRYTISYLDRSSGESTIPIESTYTVEEVILQALSAVACFRSYPGKSSSDGPVSGAAKNFQPSSDTVAFIVGTHKDQVTKEEITKFDDELKRTITNTSFYEDGLVEFASENRLVLAVDNKTGGKEEVDTIRKFLQERIKHHFKKISIPAAWLVFSLCLRKQVMRTISLENCMQLAQQFSMPTEETRVALWFLHHYAGVLMYFPDVPELKDTVICDVQIVFDSVTNMIVNTFKFGKVNKAAQDKFRETGQFSSEEVKKALKDQEKRDERLDFIPFKDIIAALVEFFPIWKKGKTPEERNEDIEYFEEEGIVYFEVKDLQEALSEIKKDRIPLEQLVKLLEHLNIIAPISQSDHTPSLSSSKQFYFMPCILQNATREELDVFCQESDSSLLSPAASLLICYECGFVPVGVFPAAIANLVGHSSLKSINEGIKKNRVQFRYGVDRDVITFICRPKYYEIRITRRLSSPKTPVHVVCSSIKGIIQATLKTVTSCMNYAFSVGYNFSFECPLHPGRDHLCTVDRNETSPYVMDCLENMKNPQPVEMHSQHLVWFGKPLTDSEVDKSGTAPITPSAPDFQVYVSSLPTCVCPHLERQLDWDSGGVDRDLNKIADHMLDWEEKLSTHLGLTAIHISDIKTVHQNKPALQRREALRRWKCLCGLQATYGNLLKLCVDAGHTQCAETICEVLRRHESTQQLLSCDEHPKNPPRLLPLCKELRCISGEWKELGLYLDLNDDKLEEVESCHGPAPFQCLKGMLKLWLAREQPPPTWDAIIEVIEFLGHDDLVVSLKQRALE